MQPDLFDTSGPVSRTLPEGFVYIADFLDQPEQVSLLRQVQELHYTHDTFRGQTLKRSYVQFGYAYVSTGRKLTQAPPFPDFVVALIERALAHCPVGTSFNQAIITHYPAGAGIGWHTDAIGFGECIMAISLGGAGRLQFRPNGVAEISHEVLVASGSLYYMVGKARWEYQHQVAPLSSSRYSLTFRSVADQGG
jgi:alkylated DNA repair protein (DNA oxidative demethylase)